MLLIKSHLLNEPLDLDELMYLKYAAQLGYDSVVVRTTDSGIFFILLHHASNIDAEVYFDTGSGKQWKLMNVTKIAIEKGQDYCTSFMGLYDFS